jgi:hypothetical protein
MSNKKRERKKEIIQKENKIKKCSKGEITRK